MRGKAEQSDTVQRNERITPAYAGKSPALRPEFAAAQDHPRLCGEKPERSRLYPCREGSPPPMRGKD